MVKARMPTSKPTRKLQAGGLAGAISAPFTTVLIYVVEKIINEPLPGEVAGAIGSIIAIALNIALVLGIMGYMGIQTTSFAALIAGAGLAIGAAWSGLLGNFAAGAFMLVLRPFNSDTLAVVAYQLARDEGLGEAALPSLAIVLVGLLPVLLLSRSMRPDPARR